MHYCKITLLHRSMKGRDIFLNYKNIISLYFISLTLFYFFIKILIWHLLNCAFGISQVKCKHMLLAQLFGFFLGGGYAWTMNEWKIGTSFFVLFGFYLYWGTRNILRDKMARLSETRYKGFINSNVPSTGKFVPLKFKMDIYPHSEFERLGRTNGSYFKAFNIEPYPYERDRVSLRMSDEDRARRAKWMKDQDLAKDEPRTHKSLMDKIIPKNAIRRLVRTPANMLEGLLANAVVGDLALSLV